MDDDDSYISLFLFWIFWCVTSLLAYGCGGNFFVKAFIFLLPFFMSLIWPKLLNLISSVGTSLIYGTNFPDLSYENRSYQSDMDKATRLVREGRWDEAMAAYRDITRKAPQKVEPRFNPARIYQKVGHLGLALSEYKKLVNLKDELGPNHALIIESERAIEELPRSMKGNVQ
jgi:tetratricopeptide (TPR) repeat protein